MQRLQLSHVVVGTDQHLLQLLHGVLAQQLCSKRALTVLLLLLVPLRCCLTSPADHVYAEPVIRNS
jgi:hypothetical protein